MNGMLFGSVDQFIDNVLDDKTRKLLALALIKRLSPNEENCLVDYLRSNTKYMSNGLLGGMSSALVYEIIPHIVERLNRK